MITVGHMFNDNQAIMYPNLETYGFFAGENHRLLSVNARNYD